MADSAAAAWQIRSATLAETDAVARLVGELLGEIMDVIGAPAFNFDLAQSQQRAKTLLERGVSFPLLAYAPGQTQPVAVLCLYEGHALYAEGDFGIIAELYVQPDFRNLGLGSRLIAEARAFGLQRGWRRLEVTTPPLPEFEQTLKFYEREGFTITGGRKLKTLLTN